MKITVLDAATLGKDLSIAPLYEVGDVTVYESTSPEETESHIHGADVLVVNKVKLGRNNLPSEKRVKLICLAATGYDNIDVEYCREAGIAVCNAVNYSTASVAQLTVAMALSLVNHMGEYTAAVQNGSYTRDGIPNRLIPVYHEVAGMTWGIVGFGNIGTQVGRVATALDCKVLVNKRTPVEGWNCVDFDTVCRESDILSLHTPLNDQTRNLLDRKHIEMLKPGAIVINVARGAVTDEEALADAVLQGKLGGLGVDVYSKEPMAPDHPFQKILHLPNVCLTPHMAWGAQEARKRVLSEIISNIQAFYRGDTRCRVD